MGNSLLILVILASASLSSLLTLALGFYLFDRRYKPRLMAEMDRRVDAYRRQFQELLDDEVERLGDTVESRVRQGVVDAVASLPSSEVVKGATQSVVKTGVDLVEAGLSGLLGSNKRDKPSS